jgi:hypothetical protein
MCYPESFNSVVIPRVKIFDVQIGGQTARNYIELVILQVFIITILCVWLSAIFAIGAVFPILTIMLACRIQHFVTIVYMN